MEDGKHRIILPMSKKEDTVPTKVVMSTTEDAPCPKLAKVTIRWRPRESPAGREIWRHVEFIISSVLVDVIQSLPINSYEIEVFVPAKGAYERWVDSPLRGWLKKLWKCRKSVK